MRTSDRGIAFIANEEGFVDHVYKDFAGVPTIGYGHALRPDETYSHLTEAEAAELLRLDIRWAEDAVNRCVAVALNQPQFDALVSFTFNEGGRAFATSTLVSRLNRGDYECARYELSRWNKYRDPVSKIYLESHTLTARRKREADLFESA